MYWYPKVGVAHWKKIHPELDKNYLCPKCYKNIDSEMVPFVGKNIVGFMSETHSCGRTLRFWEYCQRPESVLGRGFPKADNVVRMPVFSRKTGKQIKVGGMYNF